MGSMAIDLQRYNRNRFSPSDLGLFLNAFLSVDVIQAASSNPWYSICYADVGRTVLHVVTVSSCMDCLKLAISVTHFWRNGGLFKKKKLFKPLIFIHLNSIKVKAVRLLH